ncbi:hypothetical protein [Phaeobacter phage MD18]|nr:hypothetical protein [Phaeobacter phage MD18]
MKTTSNEFREHLDGEVTAVCTCWKIKRRDGVVLRFTDADQDVKRGGAVYRSIGAYKRSAIESTSDLSVDNLEVSGMATDLALPVEELRAGAYDHAEIEVFMTSWLQPIGGRLRLRKGFFGEVRVLPNGTFTVELRGIMQRLAHTFTDTYSSTCRHDLGDVGCGVPLSGGLRQEGAHYPFPILDAGFEEVGRVGLGASYTWYNPVNEENLLDSGSTYSGTYAARGSTLGGRLQQDVSLLSMDEEFLDHLDSKQVELFLHGWRQDDGDEGRVTARFLDGQMRELRAESGSMGANGGFITLPEVRVVGDWTVEMWLNPSEIDTHSLWSYRQGNVNEDTLRVLYYDSVGKKLLYRAHEDGDVVEEHLAEIPFKEKVGEWYHTAVVSEAGVLKIYVNGELMFTGGVFTGDLYISNMCRGYAGGGFKGRVDEFRVWNVARTQAEINANRWNDLPSGDPTLERYYPFDGDSADYGINETTALTIPYLSDLRTPVAVAHRGPTTAATTGFANVGTNWTLVETGAVSVPPNTRYVRVQFEHRAASGTPEGTRLDSLFGWFKDDASQRVMPVLTSADPDAFVRGAMVTTGGSNRIFRAMVDEPRASHDGWFQGGLVTFYSGKNAGASMEVKRWTAESKQIELFLSLPFPVEQGDLFTIYPGCDKSRIGCAVIFNNVVNFFGTPDVPGEDELFRYPDSK